MTQQINRRTVTKGIAWSVPAIAVAGAAPAFASSGTPPTGTLKGAFKYPGQSCGAANQSFFFGFQLEVTNSSDVGIWLYSSDNSATVGGYTFSNQGANQSVYLAPGATATYTFLMQSSNSGNESGDATIYVNWGHTQDPAGDTDHDPMKVTGYIEKFKPSQACDQTIGSAGRAAIIQSTTVVEENVTEATSPTEDPQMPAESTEQAQETEAVETEADQAELTVEEPAVEAEVTDEETE